MLLAAFLLAIATMIEPRGVYLTPIILYHSCRKILHASNNSCCKLVKYLFVLQWSILAIMIAFFTVTMWMPYELFCMPRLNLSDNLATFCTDAWPNLHLYAASASLVDY